MICSLQGYQQREAYILTQSPLENTVEEFWRMLWEYEVFTIVMISSETERSKVSATPFDPFGYPKEMYASICL